MKQPLLSILIPTVVGREKPFFKLLHKIRMAFANEEWTTKECEVENVIVGHSIHTNSTIEICWYKDDKSITIGEKREKLYQQAKGLYSWQIDDDDDIADNAIKLILQAIKSNPDVDVITFEEYCNMDGKEYKSNHSATYSGWEGEGHLLFPDGFHFHRTPFFKSVIRTELAKSVTIPHIRWSEDYEWAKLLLPLIRSEVHISEQIYRYIHISSNPEERYGLNK